MLLIATSTHTITFKRWTYIESSISVRSSLVILYNIWFHFCSVSVGYGWMHIQQWEEETEKMREKKWKKKINITKKIMVVVLYMRACECMLYACDCVCVVFQSQWLTNAKGLEKKNSEFVSTLHTTHHDLLRYISCHQAIIINRI